MVGLISISLTKQRSLEISTFRPIYYLGCKSNFTIAIEEAINDVDPSMGRICDLFSGSGVVGAALSSVRQVTAIDIQEYSRVLSSALLNPVGSVFLDSNFMLERVRSNLKLSGILDCLCALTEYEQNCINLALSGNSAALVELLEAPPLQIYVDENSIGNHTELDRIKNDSVLKLKQKGLLDSPDTTVLRYFGGVYFSFYQSAVLDGILSIAESYEEKFRDTLKAAVLSTASVMVNTVGKQFAQPIRPRNKDGSVKSTLAKVVLRDRSIDTLKTFQMWLSRYLELPKLSEKNYAYRQDYLEAIVQHGHTFSAVYADPPYTRDHYSRFYHVLETMCLRDNPKLSKIIKQGKQEISRGLYREDRHQSPFCIRSTAPEAFEELFKVTSHNNLPLVLSYSPHEAGDGTHPRVVSTSKLLEIAESYYSKVELNYVDDAIHNKFNRNDLKLDTRENAEILIKCFR